MAIDWIKEACDLAQDPHSGVPITRLTRTPMSNINIYGEQPSATPDGSRIAYIRAPSHDSNGERDTRIWRMKTLIDATNTAADPQVLRDQADRDGYLFFRGLVDRDDVLDLRRRIGAILRDAGWLDPGTDAMAAIATQPAVIEGDDAFFPVYHRIQKIHLFHELAHCKPLLEMTERLFGEPPLVHPRKIARVMFPTTPVTPPHQDFVRILGSKQTWTAWLPLGDGPG